MLFIEVNIESRDISLCHGEFLTLLSAQRRGMLLQTSYAKQLPQGCDSVPQIHHSVALPSISWWLSFATGAMVGVWIAFCLSTVTEVHVWDFVEESWIQ